MPSPLRRPALPAGREDASLDRLRALLPGIAARAADLGDRPAKRGLSRGHATVHVMAVKRQPGLQPQRVACAEADGCHALLRQKGAGEIDGPAFVDADLETVLAGIAGPADPQRAAVPGQVGRVHEAQVGRTRHQRGQRPLARLAGGDEGVDRIEHAAGEVADCAAVKQVADHQIDRHGRGLRGRLVPEEVPLSRSRAEQFDDLPLAAVIYTDIGRDGMLSGLNLDATVALARRLTTPVIASVPTIIAQKV